MIELLALLLQPDPVLMGREPRAASPWVQSVRANCGDTVLEISGYGAARPLDGVADIHIDGRAVTGPGVEPLRTDLSSRSAAYRLAIRCGDPGEIWVHISEGEKQPDGTVRFRFAAASIKDGRLRSYSGFQEGDADDFWFR